MKNLLLSFILLFTTLNLTWGQCDFSIGIVNSGDTTLSITTGFNHSLTYLWDDGETTQVHTNVQGSHCVTVTDGWGCQISKCIDIPTTTCGVQLLLSSETSYSHYAILSGKLPIVSQWQYNNNGSIITSDTLTYQGAGMYCFTMTDANGCTSSTCDNWSIPCDEDNMGLEAVSIGDDAIMVAAHGGKYPYSYTWSNGNTGSNLGSAMPEEYCITSTDAFGCKAEACITLPTPECSVTTIQNNNKLVAVPIGKSPISYQWGTNATTQSVPFSTGSQYHLTITDGNGCSSALNQGCFPNGIKFTTQGQIDSFILNYPDCHRIEGNVDIRGGFTDFNGLHNITSIGGFLKFSFFATPTNLSGLENLTSIDGSLFMLQVSVSSLTGLNNLERVGGIHLFHTQLSSLDGLTSLTEINGGISLGGNSELVDLSALSFLSTVNGSLLIGRTEYMTPTLFSAGNNALTTLEGLSNITKVKGDLYITANIALNDISGLSNLKKVEGTLIIDNNNQLPNFTGLNNLDSIGKDLIISGSDTISNLTGLDQLQSIGGNLTIGPPSFWLDFHYSGWDLSGNKNLINLNGLQNLTNISKVLAIGYNPSLSSIDGLESLHKVGSMSINHNSRLENLDGFNNLAEFSGSEILILSNDILSSILGLSNVHHIHPASTIHFRITNNPELAVCHIHPVCEAITDYGIEQIVANAVGCQSKEEVQAQCGDGITGRVFYDFNQNKYQDPDEVGIANQKVLFTPGFQVLTNQIGGYFNICDSGTTYTVEWIEDSDWSLTTDSTSYTIYFEPNNNQNHQNNFGLYPNFSSHNFYATISSNTTRCNEPIYFFDKVINSGTFLESGHTDITYNPDIVYISAYPEPTIVDTNNHFLSWNFTDLHPWNTIDYTMQFQMPNTDALPTSANLATSIYRDSSGIDVLATESSYQSEVLCSFDPNDKLVNPPGINNEHLTQKGRNLSYTIRFQNTGNTYAKDVVLRDTLDSNLDWTTFNVRNSSHKVHTSLSTDGLVTFNFKNIYLVDSTDNFDSSQGFVTYTISPKDDLPENTVINNTAHIYFDFNAAVVTNTTKNTLVTQLPVVTQDVTAPMTFTLFPNPTSDKFHILLHNNYGAGILEIVTTDLAGKTLQHQTTHNQRVINIDANYLPQGMYFISLKDKNTGAILHTKKLVKK